MLRVLDPNPHKSVVKEVICRNCGATLEYVPADITQETHHDYGGGSDTYYFIDCPKCNQQVSVKRY